MDTLQAIQSDEILIDLDILEEEAIQGSDTIS